MIQTNYLAQGQTLYHTAQPAESLEPGNKTPHNAEHASDGSHSIQLPAGMSSKETTWMNTTTYTGA